MKYFKRDLLAKCRSDDEDVAEAASECWEKSVAAYRARLKQIRGRLPVEVRNFCSHFALHDAKIIFTARHKSFPLLTIFVQLEGDSSLPGDTIQLLYATEASPRLGKTPAPEKAWILYDEFDLAEKGQGFTHSLLLTDGSVIEIPFQKFDFQKMDITAIGPPRSLPKEGRARPLVEA